ncbi:cellulase family glycosylhydrolase [Fibrobacter sp.]|uniref:cellulase family glycosylhydrolase n=1 Tax=Fibrobacter sp. TaxID=35828 RepID=UPI0038903A56
MLKFIIAAFLVVCANSFAATNQFRGVNWADKRDNFVSDVLLLSGLSLNDTYESASVVADRVIGQFVEVLGTNSVRIPINEPTASKYWNTYKAVIDVGTSYGRVDIGYWGPAQPSGPKNMDDWWKMWKTVVDDYGEDPNVYFEIFNEPHMYSKNDLRNLYATWLEKFPNVPHDHIILDGTGMAQNVPEIAEDSRFDGCLFAVHEYTFWNMGITTETGWKNSFKGKVGNFIDRTICTEWGGAMSPGDKAGVHYEYMDYNANPTNYFMAYIRGMSDQLREWEMGSFYWPGLRDGDWYSMTVREGEGANIKLTIPNQSGLDRLHMAWSDTVETTPVVQEPFGEVPVDAPADTTNVVVDSADSAVDTVKSVVEPVASPDSSIAAITSVRTFVSLNGFVKVFGVTGKFLGSVPFAGECASEALKQFGYASGTYVVRFSNGKTSRVKISR